MRKNLFLILFLLISVSCSGLGGGANPTGGGSEEGDAGFTLPISSLPPAQLTKGHVVAAAQDESGITPVVGYDGAVSSEETSGDYQIVVSHQEIQDSTDVCNKTDVTCCDTITATGSFECPVQGDNTSNYFVYVMKKDTQELSEAISEPVNPSILYLRKNPQSVANLTPDALGTNYYGSITEGLGAKIAEVDGEFKVMNSWDSNYADSGLQVTENSSELAADTSGNLAVKDDTLGLDLFDIDRQVIAAGDPMDILTTGVRVSVPDTEKYNKLKLSGDNKLRFIRKADLTRITPDVEKIYWGLNKDTDFIKYFDRDVADVAYIKNTIAFDVESSGWALVLFENDSDQLILRLVNPSRSLYRTSGYILPITCSYDASSLCNYKDLIMYKDMNAADATVTGDGKALLLDKDKNRVGVINYNFSADKTEPIAWIKLGDNKNPVAMTLSKDKKNAFIANQGDSTITVLSLFNASGSPLSATKVEQNQKIINIKELVGNKEMDIKLKDIAFTQKDAASDPYLMVSAEGLKSNLVINLRTVKISRPAITNNMPNVGMSNGL